MPPNDLQSKARAGAVGASKCEADGCMAGSVERSPYISVATALGVGFVLGGGLFTPLTARVVGVGLRLSLRLFAMPFFTEQLVELVRDAVAGPGEPADVLIGSPNGAVTPHGSGI